MAELALAAAVEAGAQALAAHTEPRDHNHECAVHDHAAVEDCGCYVLRKARKRARIVVNAAAPHLQRGDRA